MKTKDLIAHLIGEQIRNQVLILALEKLGFDCSNFTLNISEIILRLAGFNEKTDILYQQYFELVEKAANDTSYCDMDEKLAQWTQVISNELQDIEKNGLPP